MVLSGYSLYLLLLIVRSPALQCILLPSTNRLKSEAVPMQLEFLSRCYWGICKTLLPIATVTRVCLPGNLTSCRTGKAPLFQYYEPTMSSLAPSNAIDIRLIATTSPRSSICPDPSLWLSTYEGPMSIMKRCDTLINGNGISSVLNAVGL